MSAVTYSLAVDGQPLPAVALAHLRKVELEEHIALADLLRLSFTLEPKSNGSGWEVLDDDLFPRLAKLRMTVRVGSGPTIPLVEAYVVEVVVEVANDPAANLLSVVAFDATALMSLEEKVRAWPGVADSDIATSIFGEYSLTPDVEATQPTRSEQDLTVIQRGTDIQFLRTLARRNGYECYVELDPNSGSPVGHFHPPRLDSDPQGVISVGMGAASSITSLKIRHDMLRPTTASAAGVDVDSLEEQTTEVSAVAAPALGSRSTLGDQPRKLVLGQTGLALTDELQTFAQAVTDRSALAIRAEGELNAQSYGGIVRAKRPILVRGVGQELSGLYYVERVRHSFEGSDYRQSFTLCRNALGLAGREDFTIENA